MYATTWQYRVRPEHVDTFREVYGAKGDWARLFARHPGFRGTRLYQDLDNPAGFVTVDVWQDEAAFLDFKRLYGAAYQALDDRFIGMSEQWHLGTGDAAAWTGEG
ncbi:MULTISPECIES: antibiotic biosynthesis monooxygenase family protein [Kordiimonas]|mgnify:CR=1 FL=1|jgi:heme-degrading monooxygenase HmoA|uniref:antibiotic biosynthesis monooxygenase family protein n=1 Tax=Kordiimonas TaxID=288021 RepID=UPI00257E9959|nr:antibiotic biosynthesis monooxygenase family protein [Kordiimonas sp. UBA4487]